MNPASGIHRSANAKVTNFYYSFLVLPPEKRRAIEAVYDFARRGDDAVDASRSPEDARRGIAECRSELSQCYSHDGSDQKELSPLAAAIARFKIPREHFEELIFGFEMDLAETAYRTYEELALYCDHVASAIGLIAIEIFGYTNPATKTYAVHLGRALQLVNILRDLKTDAERNRVYVPQEDLDRFGVRREALRDGHPDGGVIELMRFQAERARASFAAARETLPPEDRHSMLAAEIMGAIYWRLLRKIEQHPSDVFQGRVRLSRLAKMMIALEVKLGWKGYP